MKGYIAVISRNPDADADADDAYEVHFPYIEGCVAFGSTVSQAMHEAEREGAVAAVCMRPRAA